MTLQEKFDSPIMRHDLMRNEIEETKEQFEKIADDFAIDFADWLSMFTEEFEDGDLRYWNKNEWERKTTKELLEIYKKEKGL